MWTLYVQQGDHFGGTLWSFQSVLRMRVAGGEIGQEGMSLLPRQDCSGLPHQNDLTSSLPASLDNHTFH